MTLGQKIRELRDKKNMSGDDLALAVGVSKQQISNYENNRYVPRKKVIEKLAKELGIDAAELSSLTYADSSYNKEVKKYSYDELLDQVLDLQNRLLKSEAKNIDLLTELNELRKDLQARKQA
jgi:transcriptional regulator with XRE-family HTH domain